MQWTSKGHQRKRGRRQLMFHVCIPAPLKGRFHNKNINQFWFLQKEKIFFFPLLRGEVDKKTQGRREEEEMKSAVIRVFHSAKWWYTQCQLIFTHQHPSPRGNANHRDHEGEIQTDSAPTGRGSSPDRLSLSAANKRSVWRCEGILRLSEISVAVNIHLRVSGG